MIGLNYMILCDNKWKWKYDIEFCYWMPIPEVPKEQDYGKKTT